MKPILRWLTFPAAIVGLLVADLGAAVMSYHTIGEVVSGCLLLLIFVVHIAIAMAALMSRRAAMILALALALLIVPFQALLGMRWWRVAREAKRIVAYAEERHRSTGQAPHTLDEYQFRDEYARRFVQEYLPSPRDGGFTLRYRVGTPSTSHTYSPRHGWSYYPD